MLKSAIKLISTILLALAFLSILRLIFVLDNAVLFESQNLSNIIKAFATGLRIDLILVFYTFIPSLLLSALFKRHRAVYKVLTIIWISAIGIVSLIDTAYFRFAKVRSGREIFLFFNSENNIPLSNYVKGQFPLLFFGILLLILFSWLLLRRNSQFEFKPLGILLIIAALLFIPMRGGFSGRPYRSTDAYLSVDQALVPVALNTVLLLLENQQADVGSLDLSDIEFDLKPPQIYNSDSASRPNIVILILESFGKEYTGLNRGYTHSYTPFLDSLMKESFVCESAYANGLKSIDALPAIYGGIPKLESRALTNTAYAFNEYKSLHASLEQLGYSNYFFHGAETSTMGFQSYLKKNGPIEYFSIDEYPNIENDYDGKWGVFDRPYLEYVSKKLSHSQQPFCAGVFTLSSHHPYVLPKSAEHDFKKGSLKIHPSIQYTDASLKNFFEKSAQQDWFDNTIFILLADHSSENAMHAFRTPSGKYEIPMLFFSPKYISKGRTFKTVAQTDLFPSILDLVSFPDSVWTYGNSIFQNDSQALVHHDNFTYHLTQGDFNFGMNDRTQQSLFLFNTKKDPNCLHNLLESQPSKAEGLKKTLQKSLAEYHYRMSNNTFN